MSEQTRPEPDEERLREVARHFAYPPTPDVAGRVRGRLRSTAPGAGGARPRRAVWVALAVLLLILGASVLAVPEVRALAAAILRLGSIEIVVADPTPQPATAAPGSTPSASSTPLTFTLGLAGETTLEEAQRRVSFPILLPTYPTSTGRPDKVYLQDLDGPAVIMVWLDPAQAGQPRMSLSLLSSAAMATKMVDPRTIIEETEVGGKRALWVSGPHTLRFYDSQGDIELGERWLVTGNVLIWEGPGVTYRLEVRPEVGLQEAVRIAESPAPVEGLSRTNSAAALRNLAGETTLEQARAGSFLPIRLPAYPPELGEPDRVYAQNIGGQAVILAWLDPVAPDRVRLALWQLSSDAWAEKTVDQTTVLQETTVNGERALWISGPHMIRVGNRAREEWDDRRLVEGNVLVWQFGSVTYRLESELTLEEAVRIAESVR